MPLSAEEGGSSGATSSVSSGHESEEGEGHSADDVAASSDSGEEFAGGSGTRTGVLSWSTGGLKAGPWETTSGQVCS